ncbi:ComEC/Rec2 family competence protein [Nocardioides sp.]|uniref:ComEC/Rec2 family competence protein n=1 Tax=Nocardioides sp. TaxID=35761 RepID=UPI0031FE4795
MRTPDLRMPLLALGAWIGGLAANLVAVPLVGVAGALGLVTVVLLRGWGLPIWRTAGALLLVIAAVACSGLVRQHQTGHNPVSDLASQRAAVTVVATVGSDPRVLSGRFGDQVMVRLDVHRVTGRGSTFELTTPVLLIGDLAWGEVPLGATVRASGRLSPSDGSDVAGMLGANGKPETLAPPDLWWRGADALRQSLRDSVASRPADQRALVPALVDGDDTNLDAALADDFRDTGLTHLLAVSGTNLTLVVGFLLVVARWSRVRGRWLYVVGGCGIAGFVLLARTEPSVLRAAVMGTVGLFAMGVNGRERGFRALGVAVVTLLLVQPALATSIGFALSVLATTGILVLAPGWRDDLSRWLPRWLAEAVAVPAAAQLACTPLVAAISGQVSIVAVAANLVVAPAVGPATVLGLVGGLLGLVWDPAGRLAGAAAGWCVAWIVEVAHRGASLPSAAIEWGTGAVSLAVLTVLCAAAALVAPHLLRRRTTGLGCALLMVVAVVVRPPTPGWPPDGWVLAMCDIGQGDALVLNAGPGTGIVVDAGPDPALVDRCLSRLDVERVPLVVLTHFHADHVDGLAGVLDGRSVGAIETTRLQDPPEGVDVVTEAARSAGVPISTAAFGGTRTIGDVTFQVLWPPADSPSVGPGDGSTANEASVVLLVEIRGMRLLLTGDVEPEGQAALAGMLPGLHVDVLKLPHHGSRYQDLDFLESLQAGLVLVSVGADNDYGHPSAEALEPLAATGATILRTDLDGDVVVARRGDSVVAVTSAGP